MYEIAGRGFPAGFTIEPHTDNCRRICAEGGHALVGVSPGNGYFSEERLSHLLRWAGTAFDRVDAIIPDASLVHTHRALGEPPERALRKAAAESARTRRRVERAWQAIGVPPREQRVHLLSEFTDHPTYRALRRDAEEAVRRDAAVREVFRHAGAAALRTRLKGAEPAAHQVEEAMNYLVAEMPLCTDTPGILGVPTSVNVYHQVIPAISLLFASRALYVSPGQAFALVRPAVPEAVPEAVPAGPRPARDLRLVPAAGEAGR
ncbi:hypothetical protein Misp01_19970 [Microtetraspora sp. NBRC 13810]|uniref:tRNA-dependent cyclodipeptide synthase n=1 Tax=Microtetraspora sp. NBRC 13810 TaxID=3030990 RepID=UPI0024A19C26|nr:tRNA-dependent cyclodipeptide synthase [Microtetraspora sp. NBRC 13810]GLW06867.1 hypothetical protein Misp01_19970 [Microtetraspora sp. NBRC 13810]